MNPNQYQDPKEKAIVSLIWRLILLGTLIAFGFVAYLIILWKK